MVCSIEDTQEFLCPQEEVEASSQVTFLSRLYCLIWFKYFTRWWLFQAEGQSGHCDSILGRSRNLSHKYLNINSPILRNNQHLKIFLHPQLLPFFPPPAMFPGKVVCIPFLYSVDSNLAFVLPSLKQMFVLFCF